MTDATLSTTKAEVLHPGEPAARLSATKIEVLHPGQAAAQLSAIKIEVLYAHAIPAFPRRTVVVVTG